MEKRKKVVGTLVGVNGNAFALMAHFKRLALRQGWEPSEVKKVLDEAMSGNYHNLIRVLTENMIEPEDEG